MLYEIGLENFKPFGAPQAIPCARLTLIYGPNSGGKSSIIQSLMLLRQTIEDAGPMSSGLITRGRYVDLGSFKSLVHRHNTKRRVAVELSYDRLPIRGAPLGGLPPADQSRTVRTVFEAAQSPGSRKRDSSALASVGYQLRGGAADLNVTLRRVKGDRAALSATTPLWQGVGGRAFEWADAQSRRSLARWDLTMSRAAAERRRRARPQEASTVAPELPESEVIDALDRHIVLTTGFLPTRLVPKGEAYSDEDLLLARRRISGRLLEAMSTEYVALIRSLSYLGPLRVYPERHYVLTGGDKDSVGVRGENTPETLYRHRGRITNQVNEWFRRFDIPYQLSVDPIGDEVTGDIVMLRLVDERLGIQVSPSDVGFGIGQLLPILVEGLVAESRILCVEQPEIHLHPRLQAHLGDLLIATSKASSASTRSRANAANQWIVETHSEALMLRIQRRIREGVISPDDVSIVYVEPSGEGGSVVLPLRLDSDGAFMDEWPSGFFEDAYNEMLGGPSS